MVGRIWSGSNPKLKVKQAWGSRSMTRTVRPCSDNAAARDATEVVFATPPFWWATAITRAIPRRFVHGRSEIGKRAYRFNLPRHPRARRNAASEASARLDPALRLASWRPAALVHRTTGT